MRIVDDLLRRDLCSSLIYSALTPPHFCPHPARFAVWRTWDGKRVAVPLRRCGSHVRRYRNDALYEVTELGRDS